MNKKFLILASVLLLGNIVPTYSNYTNNSPCEVAGITMGTLAALVACVKEYKKTLNHTTQLVGFDGLCYSIVDLVVGPIFLQLGQVTAKLADGFIKEASATLQSTRTPIANKIGNTALNTAGACCVLPISLALSTVGGQVIGQGMGHIGALGTEPVIEIVRSAFDMR